MMPIKSGEDRPQSKMSEPVKISSRSSVRSTLSLPPIPFSGQKEISSRDSDVTTKDRRRKRDDTFNSTTATAIERRKGRERNMDMMSMKSLGRSSLVSYHSGKSSLDHKKVNFENEIELSQKNNTSSLDTERAIPIVEWKKVSSIPETDGMTDTGETMESVDLKKCLTCGNDKVILKLLPCLHSFCEQCLELLTQEHPSRPWIRCGLCKKQTLVPSRGITGFEDNTYFQFSQLSITEDDKCSNCRRKTPSCKCSECSLLLCTDCVYLHLNEDSTKSHYIVNVKKEMVGQSAKSTVCEDHQPFTLDLFCVTCSVPICGRCAINKHNNHIAENIQVTANDKRNELKALMSDTTTRRSMMAAKEHLKSCEREKANFQSDVEKAVNSIQVHIQALKDELDEAGKSLITGLIEKEVAVLASMQRNIEEAITREKASFASFETLKQIISRTRDMDLISKFHNLKAVIAEVKAACKPPPSTSMRIKYKPLLHSLPIAIGRVDVGAFLKKPVHYVEVSSLQLSKHIHCIMPLDNTKAWIGFRKYIQLCGKDGNLGPRLDLEEPVYGLDANSNGTVFAACKTSVKVITSKLQIKLLFQLLHEPSDLKITEKDLIIISFRDAKRVALFDTKGKVVTDLDVRHFGFRFGIRINEPYKLAVNETGDTYLTDFSSEAIGIFDSQCEIKNAFDSNVYRHASLCCEKGLLFIADYKRDCVHIYSQDGHVLQTCQTQGVSAPNSIAVDKTGDLWLGCWNGIVKVYTPRSFV